MNEIEMALLRHEQRKSTPHKKNYDEKNTTISNVFTKILLSVIFLLSSVIYIKLSPENLDYFKKNIFESNFTFMKINNWYHELFGSILPTVTEPKENLVSSNSNTPLKREEYLDGYKLTTSTTTPVENITSGILVFMGEKEGYGNTMIIQGVDGVDIWYGGITDASLKLYDYVEANTILGNTENDYYYLVYVKDGENLTYEKYQEISS